MIAGAAVVTGATGFIGRNLVRRLVAEGRAVVALVRPGSERSFGRGVEVMPLQEWTEPAIAAALGRKRIGAVFHLAAYGVRPADRDPETMRRVNEILPATMVSVAAARGAVVVTAGSAAEYVPVTPPAMLTEDAPLEKESLYGSTKARGGLAALERAAALGVSLRHLRLFNVFGAGEPDHRLFTSLLARLPENRRVPLSAGTQIRDFVEVGEAVAALMGAADDAAAAPAPGARVWNVCTGRGHSVREFALTVARLMAKPTSLLGFGDLPLRLGETAWLVGDPSRIAHDLGWRARGNFAEAVAAALGVRHPADAHG